MASPGSFARALLLSGAALAACGNEPPAAPPPALTAAAQARLAAHADPRAWQDLDAQRPGRRLRDPRTGIVFVRVPAGEFAVGSDTAFDATERPAHRVTLSRDFLLAETELTIAQWRTFVADFAGDPAVPVPSGEAALPMPLSCADAESLCARFGYRLPTEVEWERACRGGLADGGLPWATEEGMRACAWFHRNSDLRSHPVAQKQPNGYGLHDMLGNLWEWCADDFDPLAWSRHGANAVDPRTPGTTTGHRVLRGGSWFSAPPALPHTRKSGGYAERNAFFGCRPACDAPPR